REKFLRKVLRVRPRVAMPPDKGVDRETIHPAKHFKRFPRFRRIEARSPTHQAPASLFELRRLAVLGIEVFGDVCVAHRTRCVRDFMATAWRKASLESSSHASQVGKPAIQQVENVENLRYVVSVFRMGVRGGDVRTVQRRSFKQMYGVGPC